MKCEKCSNERENGSEYVFFYGKLMQITAPSPGFRKHNYGIAGQEKAWICNLCVIRKFLLTGTGISTILFVLSLITWLFEPNVVQRIFDTDPTFIGVMGTIVFGFVLMRHVMLFGFESVTHFGDMVAYEAKHEQLERQGYNSFFTRGQRKQLRS
ncbi:MAG: hypothetical protein GWN00_31145 [Aliifodinibius sp.]|nr:hypothetical protein [candidate division Zixibacteria bacterium]NIT60500.1 hypothetical protein [Fodinibius sp.]NIW48170.1 hypothetical protein [Gammaproteobacteria bacterium]NIR66680.1 hypothetical protein [candidate division Zixibacteria bacterium]NIS48214.1 hypothetical protein [candidate division Zixibacteria bacterium]